MFCERVLLENTHFLENKLQEFLQTNYCNLYCIYHSMTRSFLM